MAPPTHARAQAAAALGSTAIVLALVAAIALSARSDALALSATVALLVVGAAAEIVHYRQRGGRRG